MCKRISLQLDGSPLVEAVLSHAISPEFHIGAGFLRVRFKETSVVELSSSYPSFHFKKNIYTNKESADFRLSFLIHRRFTTDKILEAAGV